MRHPLTILVVLTIATTGCGKKAAEDKVTMVADDDPRMNAAIAKARSTVTTFTAALRSPKRSQTSFSIKMAFHDGKQTEHMWLTRVSFDGKNFQGTVNNEPRMVSNVKMGQQASVESEKISDWMFVENHKLVGGYTIRVLRDAMPEAERADFDKSVPFQVD